MPSLCVASSPSWRLCTDCHLLLARRLQSDLERKQDRCFAIIAFCSLALQRSVRCASASIPLRSGPRN